MCVCFFVSAIFRGFLLVFAFFRGFRLVFTFFTLFFFSACVLRFSRVFTFLTFSRDSRFHVFSG